MKVKLGGLVTALFRRGPRVRSLPKSAGHCPSAMGGRHVVSDEEPWDGTFCVLCAQFVDG